MKIVSLSENISLCDDIQPEHGLSLYIQTGHMNILFDMGQGELFADNADKLGVDLSLVDVAVLSHGHYDHGGGLEKFLSINSSANVYVRKDAFEKHYNGTEKYIGLDSSLMSEKRLVFTDDTEQITENITLYSCNGKKKYFDLGSFGLNKMVGNGFVPDDFTHEQYLLINESGKKVLISGCSHKGILNIAKWFEPDVLVGGFHFSKLPTDSTLEGYAKYLDGFDTDFYTCHCTGTEQYEFMKRYMRKLNYLSCGETLII